jgi:hypothetical protein
MKTVFFTAGAIALLGVVTIGYIGSPDQEFEMEQINEIQQLSDIDPEKLEGFSTRFFFPKDTDNPTDESNLSAFIEGHEI